MKLLVLFITIFLGFNVFAYDSIPVSGEQTSSGIIDYNQIDQVTLDSLCQQVDPTFVANVRPELVTWTYNSSYLNWTTFDAVNLYSPNYVGKTFFGNPYRLGSIITVSGSLYADSVLNISSISWRLYKDTFQAKWECSLPDSGCQEGYHFYQDVCVQDDQCDALLASEFDRCISDFGQDVVANLSCSYEEQNGTSTLVGDCGYSETACNQALEDDMAACVSSCASTSVRIFNSKNCVSSDDNIYHLIGDGQCVCSDPLDDSMINDNPDVPAGSDLNSTNSLLQQIEDNTDRLEEQNDVNNQLQNDQADLLNDIYNSLVDQNETDQHRNDTLDQIADSLSDLNSTLGNLDLNNSTDTSGIEYRIDKTNNSLSDINSTLNNMDDELTAAREDLDKIFDKMDEHYSDINDSRSDADASLSEAQTKLEETFTTIQESFNSITDADFFGSFTLNITCNNEPDPSFNVFGETHTLPLSEYASNPVWQTFLDIVNVVFLIYVYFILLREIVNLISRGG